MRIPVSSGSRSRQMVRELPAVSRSARRPQFLRYAFMLNPTNRSTRAEPEASHARPQVNPAAVAALGDRAGVRHAVELTDCTWPRTGPVRGHAQSVHLYGVTNARPVIVSSGDGGWIYLGPHVARLLAAHGYFVVGFDVRAYLKSFTAGRARCTPTRRRRIFGPFPTTRTLLAVQADPHRHLGGRRALGAGRSESLCSRSIAGVIAIGLPDRNELGWRWKDSVVYLTHGVPNEPTFSAAALVDKVSPLPLALVHSTHDEFVPLTDAQRMLGLGGEPRRLWVVPASDHRFSDNLSEFDQRPALGD